MRDDASYGNVDVYPDGGPRVRYTEARFCAHPDGDLTIHSRTVATAAVWARGSWQRVEAVK